MLSVFKPIKPVSLLPHQDEAVSWMTFMESSSGYRGGILADNMGLGKTFSIMGLILADIKRGVELPNLIIVPKAMVDTWVDTYKDYNFSVYSICSKKREWVQKSVGSSFVYITHYHAVLGKPWLFSRFWHRIIIDEAHNIRNFKGALYRAISVLVSFYKWYVTATPVINSIKDIVAPMNGLVLDVLR